MHITTCPDCHGEVYALGHPLDRHREYAEPHECPVCRECGELIGGVHAHEPEPDLCEWCEEWLRELAAWRALARVLGAVVGPAMQEAAYV